MWNKTYGGTDRDMAYSIVQTNDNGFAIAGQTWITQIENASYEAYLWLVKTDSEGNVQWNMTYGRTWGDEDAATVVQTSDGGYAIAGSFVFSGSNWKFWLIKTDAAGNAEWNKTYGTGGIDQCLGMIQTLDGGYLLTGQEWSGPNEGGIVVKTDSEGNIEWNRTYIDTYTKLYKAVQTEDGGYALAGEWLMDVVGHQALLIKTNLNGIVQWYRNYGGEGEEYFSSMARTTDGGYALAGWTSSLGAGIYDFWLVKTDDSGIVQFSKTFGGSSGEVARSIIQTNDGGYAIAGPTSSFGVGDYDFWLVKTDANGVIPEFSEPFGTILLVGTALTIVVLGHRLRRYRSRYLHDPRARER
jgi:hypothetical protein